MDSGSQVTVLEKGADGVAQVIELRNPKQDSAGRVIRLARGSTVYLAAGEGVPPYAAVLLKFREEESGDWDSLEADFAWLYRFQDLMEVQRKELEKTWIKQEVACWIDGKSGKDEGMHKELFLSGDVQANFVTSVMQEIQVFFLKNSKESEVSKLVAPPPPFGTCTTDPHTPRVYLPGHICHTYLDPVYKVNVKGKGKMLWTCALEDVQGVRSDKLAGGQDLKDLVKQLLARTPAEIERAKERLLQRQARAKMALEQGEPGPLEVLRKRRAVAYQLALEADEGEEWEEGDEDEGVDEGG